MPVRSSGVFAILYIVPRSAGSLFGAPRLPLCRNVNIVYQTWTESGTDVLCDGFNCMLAQYTGGGGPFVSFIIGDRIIH